jgi:hypothetical protein
VVKKTYLNYWWHAKHGAFDDSPLNEASGTIFSVPEELVPCHAKSHRQWVFTSGRFVLKLLDLTFFTKGPWVAAVALQITEEEIRGFDVITGHGIPDCTFKFLFYCNYSNLNWRRIKLVLTTFKLTAEKGRPCIGFEKLHYCYCSDLFLSLFYHLQFDDILP